MALKTQLISIFVIASLGLISIPSLGQTKGDPREQVSQIDLILVQKALRKLSIYSNSELIKSYRISLGASPVGHKQQEGDEKTPEGKYTITHKNTNSRFHLSLLVSYPNAKDRTQAKARGVSAGGNIMIHGAHPKFSWIGGWHRYWDWTDGCIAVTNKEIEEIFDLTEVDTEIRIEP